MVTNKRYYSRRRTLAEIKRRRRRRRKIRVWCARFTCLAVLGLLICLIGVIIHCFVSLADNIQSRIYASPEAMSQPLETVTVVETLPISKSLGEGYESEKQEVLRKTEVPTQEVTPTPTVASLPEPQLSAYGPGEVYYYEFSYEDKVLIAKTVHQEARGECFEGQVAVASVVINRYFSDDPVFENDSIYSVVTQDGQFADITGVTDEDLANCPSCMEAVEAACKGWDPTRATFAETGATYFYELEGLSDYQRSIRTDIEELIIGKHHFHIDFNMDAVNN